MAITLTFHGARPADVRAEAVDALGPQLAAAQAVSDNYTIPATGLYRVKAGAEHTVRFGDGALASASGGESWDAGEKEVRWLRAGDKVYVA